jgi:hypothetical protein
MAAVVVGTFLSLIVTCGHAQVVAPLSEVKAIVFDESGAVILDCEVVFRGDSETIASHTGMDGSVTVTLRSGRYALTTTRAGFVKSKMLDVQIVTPMSDALRIVLKVDHSPSDGPIVDGVPTTTTSDVPSLIEPEPNRVPSPQPATRKNRSWQCLYLWRCSPS